MKYFITCLFFFTFCIFTDAQNKQDYVWLWGVDRSPEPGIQGYKFDFNIKPFTISTTNIGVEFDNNNASISHETGNLLFYSNGCAVLNRDAKIMPNGDSINPGLFFDTLWEGDCINNGYPGTQNIIILPDPKNTNSDHNGYYIIHKPNIKIVGKPSFTQDILYTYVDMSLDGGKGDVVKKNVLFYNEKEILSSYLTAINHKNGKDWWILQPIKDTNGYLTFLLDSSGFKLVDEQYIGKVFDWNASASGTAKFSPDGKNYAYYNESDGLLLFDFDRNTGLLSNYKRVVSFDTTGQSIFCSVEWSPNSRFVYTATKTKLHQIDTHEENLQDGIRLIGTYDGTKNPFSNTFFLMAQGPDCRIYMCSTNGNRTYHVINKPDELGAACDFVQNGIVLPYSAGRGSMPNFPRFRVDEAEKCDPTIVSVFGDYVWYRRDIKVWPNPSSGVFNIELPDVGAGKLVVTNINGQVLFEKDVSNIINDERIDITKYPAGRYNIEFYPESKSKERVFYGGQVVKVKSEK
jgi:hypothetical protein